MSQKLAKSPEMISREAELKDLQTQLKKKQAILKSLKTRLLNTKKEIEEIGQKAHATIFRLMEEMDSLRVEIADLARQLKNAKGLSRDKKEQLRMMADLLSDPELMGAPYQEYKQFKQQQEREHTNFDEFERARMRSIFQGFEVKPKDDEQKDIRKVFLKLSQKFHPDLARNENEAKKFHLLMQQINEAYQHNDIQSLLELESLYLLQESDFSIKAVTVDSLWQEIDHLKRDLRFIEQQIDRTSQEIKNLRQSDLGTMLTSVNKADREGLGLDQTIADIEKSIQMLSQMRDGLKDSVRLGHVSPILEQLMMETIGEEEDSGQTISSAWEYENALNFFDEFDDDNDEEEEIENPVFPIGSSVRVAVSVKSPFKRKVNMQGWEGRVTGAWHDFNGYAMYAVSMDSHTIQQMPIAVIEAAINEETDFSELIFEENQLAASQARDTEGQAVIAYRRIYHGLAWKKLPDKAMAARLEGILLQYTGLSDEDNWTNYLLYNLSFPFDATTRGGMGFKEGTRVKVLKMSNFNEDIGHVVMVKAHDKRNQKSHPLADLKTSDRNSKAFQVLEDYYVWSDHGLMI
jgi:predicted  nucleic acid-binding Zn-ribbon protein